MAEEFQTVKNVQSVSLLQTNREEMMLTTEKLASYEEVNTMIRSYDSNKRH